MRRNGLLLEHILHERLSRSIETMQYYRRPPPREADYAMAPWLRPLAPAELEYPVESAAASLGSGQRSVGSHQHLTAPMYGNQPPLPAPTQQARHPSSNIIVEDSLVRH